MKRLVFLFLIIAGFLFSFQTDNIILWAENRKLTWDDFKGKPDTTSPYKAKTESNFSMQIGTKGMEAIIGMQNCFNKNKSWVKEKNNLLLEHEQTHFDIAEIWMRKFKQLLQGKTFTVKTFQQELNAMHSEINRGGKEMNARYDKETEHSVNQEAQKKWNKRVAEELKSLNAYTSPKVTCKLTK
ncbi:MAG TPA: DUF922 domain-containing protein [Bacteroidia bacterium]|jgi:hypothetical protein|nr:DUF922 domain-containing protein [Bacteroidia bacterium]